MKIQRIRLTIVLVLIALLALIGVQLFWATRSYQLSKKTFESNVMEALQRTVEDYNKRITCFELFSKVRVHSQEGIYMLRHSIANNKYVSPDSIAPDTVPFYFAAANDRIPFDYGDLSFSWPVDLEMILRFEFLEIDSPNATPHTSIRKGNINVHNFRELFSSDKSLEERYDAHYIDSVLRDNLRNYSITDSFHFGYVRNDTALAGFVSPGATEEKLLKSTLRFPLGADQYFSQPYDLALYFDNPDGLIFAGLKTVLVLSVLVVLILLFSFYYAIRIILRQRKLSQLKNDFINNMTHEFKTPLANISIALETIDAGSGSSERRERILQIIGQETERLQENVEKILQVARFEQGAIQLSFEELNINQLVKKAVSYFETRTETNGVDISCELKADPGTIHADETHLINVLCNLVDNAIKYSDNTPVITIRTENNHKGIYLSVMDKGIGMKEETKKRIFEKFYRASTGNIHRVQGFGLGLSYVKSIVDSHLGDVEVKSQPGKGSEFIIHLPYQP
ncbi:MAG: HAMP domain-containing histidine kinase [Bacteroidia bacterium]|nr:HAMP domain-containing histidine kinase [Bacteroidia bacterium]